MVKRRDTGQTARYWSNGEILARTGSPSALAAAAPAADEAKTNGDFEAWFKKYKLDLNDPKMLDADPVADKEGIDVLRTLRDGGHQLPVLVVTARTAVHDRVLGLNQGADDYLTKPFDIEELAARLKALVRRAYGSNEMGCGLLRVDTASGAVCWLKGSVSPRQQDNCCVSGVRGAGVAFDALRMPMNDGYFGSLMSLRTWKISTPMRRALENESAPAGTSMNRCSASAPRCGSPGS